MATREVKKQVEIALAEIGPIKPWFDKEFNAWIFSSSLYPIECEGKTAKDVIKKYPKYLEIFIEHRMLGKIDEINERKTKGKAGVQPKPISTKKEATKQIRVPLDIANLLKEPGVFAHLRGLIDACHHTHI